MSTNNKKNRVTAKEVALDAGVSVSAVSRSFTEGASIAAKTRAKVTSSALRLGYRPNLMARSLMTRQTQLIGIVANNFANPLFTEVFDLFSRQLQSSGMRPLLANLSDGRSLEAAVDMLLQYNVDAVLVASSTMPQEFLRRCVEAGLITVQAFGRVDQVPGLSVVTADNDGGGRQAAQLLLERGHRNIGFLGGPQFASSTQDRYAGFCAQLRRAGLELAAVDFAHNYSYQCGREASEQMLRAYPELDALFCGDDIIAIGALDSCRRLNYSVPGDIAILGYNDIEMAAWPAFQLSTIHQPSRAIISYATKLIARQVASAERRAENRRFACEPVLRATLRQPV